MKKLIPVFVILVSCVLYLAGCTGANQTARNAGRPIGGAASVPQSVTQGIAEGYADGDANENPYGR